MSRPGGKAFTVQADMSDASGARDLGPKGITINYIQPGPLDTELNPTDSEFAPAITPMTSAGRYGNTDEVADLVTFVASPGELHDRRMPQCGWRCQRLRPLVQDGCRDARSHRDDILYFSPD